MTGVACIGADLMPALAHGFNLVKFFANAAAWLSEPNVVAVGGSWLCPAADIRSGNRAGISAICQRTMKSLKPA